MNSSRVKRLTPRPNVLAKKGYKIFVIYGYYEIKIAGNSKIQCFNLCIICTNVND
ncbi:hypothetical protein LCDVSa039L [Lymphocystis disease virus 3]|uniref:Uncharacterized protein n=1 Tax=Lymphocystis disease virus 3 TaxID=2560566 RepID=A0A1B2RVU2_9VIRU|nr:hypothetical protein BZK12_gp039 [Lymphocystis disease virus Sa]AOC55123.1 hypothetical protein LCDVSa039L [Lymphocystis disease virus 3]